MKLLIGENIKRLRRGRDLTQEELAEILGVSFQSVSRWENGACYPDMELIPAIASYFGVSSDELLGVDEAREERAVRAVLAEFQSAVSRGEIDRCIGVAREGLKEHPNSYPIMNKLMYALFLAGDDTGNIPDWKENMLKYDAEIIRLGERIMKYCPDSEIRLEATARLAFNHCEMGRREQGRQVYETLPGIEFAREGQIWWALTDEEKPANARELIRKSSDLMGAGIWQLIRSGALSDAEQEAAAEKYFELEKLTGAEAFSSGQMRLWYAQIFARQGKSDEAAEQLEIAVRQAIAFDARPESGVTDSLLLGRREWKRSDYETADTRPVVQVMREYWLQHADFDPVRETESFVAIVNRLEAAMKG